MSRSLVDDNAEKKRFCSIKELYMYIHTYIHMYLCIYPSCSSARHFVHYHSSWGHFLLEINTLGLCPGKGFSDIPSCWGNPTSRGLLKKKRVREMGLLKKLAQGWEIPCSLPSPYESPSVCIAVGPHISW